MNGFESIFSMVKQNPILFAVVILIIVVIVMVIIKKMTKKEMMEPLEYGVYGEKESTKFVDIQKETEDDDQIIEPTTSFFTGSGVDFDVTGEDILPLNLLPVSPVSGEAVLNGSGSLSDRNFLTSTSGFGIDTIGSSKRLSTYDIRGEPTVTVNLNTSPFYQSTHTGNPYQRNMVME